MKLKATAALVVIALLCGATLASATTIRGSSGNGADTDAVDWLLLGRIPLFPLSANGKSAKATREIVCMNQDVEATLPTPDQTLAGSCNNGNYMYLFQLQSTSTDVSVKIGRLVGFDQSDPTSYGVMRCDNSSVNSIEMCTTATVAEIPTITTTTGNTAVTFTVPGTFPSYPAGTAQQGQGLTFFVIVGNAPLHTIPPLPLPLPTIGVH